MVEVDDLIILGRAVPVLLKDRRRTICTAGYSEQFGFLRVYPTYYTDNLRRWDIVSIKIGIDRRNSREESWKRDSSSKFEVIDSIKNNRKGKEELLESIYEDICTKDLNENKRSLAIIKPEILKVEFAEAGTTADRGAVAQTLLDFMAQEPVKKRAPLRVKRDFQYIPYISYRCGTACKTKSPHHQQVLEWGIYRWMEKNPDNVEQVWENLRITDEDYYKYFFIGNLRDRRTTWLIISILRGKKGRGLKITREKKVIYTKKELISEKAQRTLI